MPPENQNAKNQTNQSQPYYFLNDPAYNSPDQSSSGQKKRIFFAGLIAAGVLLFGGILAYMGIYAANRPSELWNQALNNTAQGYDNLVTYAKENKTLANKGEISGGYSYETDSFSIEGKYTGFYADNRARINLEGNSSGDNLTSEFIAENNNGSDVPDVYLRAKGLRALRDIPTLETDSDSLRALEDQWYLLDSSTISQLRERRASNGPSIQAIPNNDQIIQIAETVGSINRQYVFTSDPSRAILIRSQNLGEEELDGRQVYRFKATYNIENLEAYLNSLAEELQKTKFKEIYGETGFEKMLLNLESFTGEEQVDVWVDMNTDLIYKIHSADQAFPEAYIDITLAQNGETGYEFVWDKTNADEGTDNHFRMKLTIDPVMQTLGYEIDSAGDSDIAPVKTTFNGKVVPTEENIKIDIPSGVVPLADKIEQLSAGGYEGIDAVEALFSGSLIIDSLE